MNILQQQNSAKELSDQQLQQELLNPTGALPSYLALSELQRRKDMRSSYQSLQGKPGSSMAEEFARGLGGADVGKYGEAVRGAMPSSPGGEQPPMQAPMQAPMQPPMQAPMQDPMQAPQQQFAEGGAIMAPGATKAVGADMATIGNNNNQNNNNSPTWSRRDDKDILGGFKKADGSFNPAALGPLAGIIAGQSVGDSFKGFANSMVGPVPRLMGFKGFADGGPVHYDNGGVIYGNTSVPDLWRMITGQIPLPSSSGNNVPAITGPFSSIEADKAQEALRPTKAPLAPSGALPGPTTIQDILKGIGVTDQRLGIAGASNMNPYEQAPRIDTFGGADSGGPGTGSASDSGTSSSNSAAADASAADAGAAAAGAAAAGASGDDGTGGGTGGTYYRGGRVGFKDGNTVPWYMPSRSRGQRALGLPESGEGWGLGGFPVIPNVPYGPAAPKTYSYDAIPESWVPPMETPSRHPFSPTQRRPSVGLEDIEVPSSPTASTPSAPRQSFFDSSFNPPLAEPPPEVTSNLQDSPSSYGPIDEAAFRPGPIVGKGSPTSPPGGGIPNARGPGGGAGGGGGGAANGGVGAVVNPDLAGFVGQVRGLQLPDRFGEIEARNQKEREDLKAGRETDKGLAMLQAGMTMAGGTSPYALANISAGATAGIKEWGAAEKEFRVANQAIRSAENAIQIARANRDEKQLEMGVRVKMHFEEMREKAAARREAAAAAAGARSDAREERTLDRAENRVLKDTQLAISDVNSITSEIKYIQRSLDSLTLDEGTRKSLESERNDRMAELKVARGRLARLQGARDESSGVNARLDTTKPPGPVIGHYVPGKGFVPAP